MNYFYDGFLQKAEIWENIGISLKEEMLISGAMPGEFRLTYSFERHPSGGYVYAVRIS